MLRAASGRSALDMNAVRTFEVDDCALDLLLEAKQGRSVSVCIPCRDEAATIGPLVSMVRHALMQRAPLVDELIVLDDRSTDDTATVAASAGATVIPIDDIHVRHGVGHGKGNVLWASLAASTGDFVVYLDGDVTSFEPTWIAKLLAPMIDDDTVALVKAIFHRPTQLGGCTNHLPASTPGGGPCSRSCRTCRGGASRSRS
jgi:glucosyl-3-phosphoglycerate synthase